MIYQKKLLKDFLLIHLFLFALPCLTMAQEDLFLKVDSFAVSFEEPYEDVASLAVKLTEPFDTEIEKARALFMWIAQNVRYDCKKYHSPRKAKISASNPEELEKKIEEWRNEQIEKTAKYKRGICGDYSQLYKAMCDEIGLEALVISGNARDFHKPYRNAHDNPHAWNAIKIENKWYLLDATWGAGNTDANVTKFRRKLAEGFFMTPPSWFAQNHFPDKQEWQLLESPLDKNEFANQAMINYGQTKYLLENFSTSVKTIEGKKYNSEIRIKFKQSPKYFFLANQKSKPIEFHHQKEDGFDVFRFSSKGERDFTLYGGEYRRSKMGWLAKYDL